MPFPRKTGRGKSLVYKTRGKVGRLTPTLRDKILRAVSQAVCAPPQPYRRRRKPFSKKWIAVRKYGGKRYRYVKRSWKRNGGG